MGFYGNITNTSNTTFSFDRIYPNKQSMEANVNNDGIFIGRYVLIEYDQDAAYPVIYKKPNENRFYSSKNFEQATEIKLLTGEQADEYKLTEDDSVISGKQYYKKENNKYIAVSLNSNDIPSDLGLYEYVSTADGVYKGEIVQVQTIQTDNNGNLITILIDFYECVGGSDGIAQFDQIGEEPNAGKSNYIKNFAIDEKHLNGEQQKSFKGYDSTVWMKSSVTASDGKLISKYVNIADLNSVVPTFDITEDAPTMNALTPHFDADSTNVYYKLHMQTPYGFRIKQVDNGKGSDLKTQHIKATYDINNNMIGKSAEEVNADIYYNKAGFEEETSSFKESGSDIITILPSGDSGKTYKHTPVLPDNMKDIEKWDGDIQELSIRLPSIGNTISKIWDIVYDNDKGYGADYGTRQRDLDWQYVTNDTNGELRKPDKGGKTLDTSTIAGCINHVHKLMGQIIVNGKTNELTEDKKKYIYYDDNKYWKIVDSYSYNQVNTVDNDIYYVMEDATGAFSRGALWNNSVKEIPAGIKIGTRTTSLTWKELDLGKQLDTLHGQILQFNHIYSDALVDSETRDDDTIVGTLNKLNDIIAKFDNLIPGEFVVVDEYGRIHSAAYTTSQSYTSVNYGKSIDGENTDSYETTEDRWIGIEMDTDYNNPFITITHNFTSVDPTTTSSDKNDPEGKDGINNDTDDNLQLYTPIVDATGHVVGKNIETVTLPYGYKKIAAENSNAVTAAPVTTTTEPTANNTQDTLNLTASNKWIKFNTLDSITNPNEVQIGHILSPITSSLTTTQLDSNEIEYKSSDTIINTFGGNFNILNFKTDNAGHIIAVGQDIITIPEGKYEKDTPNTDSSSLLVGMVLDGPTGEITTTSATTNTLQLSNYTYIGNGTKDTQTVANGQSINTALGTLEKRINNLDYADPDANTTQFVSKVTEEEGIIKVERANVGGLVLTGYTASGKGNGEVGATDTVNSAFAKIENKINTFLKDADLTTNAIDTLKELQTYIITHGTEANNMLNAINTIYKVENGTESGKLIDKTDALDKRINNLNSSVNATNGKYISSIIISNDTLSIGETALPTYTLKGGTANGTIKLNEEGNDVFVTGLGSAAFTEASAYVDATTYANNIKELEDKIKELEDKLNPEPETPVEGE